MSKKAVRMVMGQNAPYWECKKCGNAAKDGWVRHRHRRYCKKCGWKNI
jgi:predicted RNA-binding Zn-ribbon protein involved in translation (DUF1610 family)